MQLRWTAEAAHDLERIAEYLLTHTLDRAHELVRAVYDAPSALMRFPNRGRVILELAKLDISGYRELSVPPYRIVYRADRASVPPAGLPCALAAGS